MTIARGQMNRQLYGDGPGPDGIKEGVQNLMENKLSQDEIDLIIGALENNSDLSINNEDDDNEIMESEQMRYEVNPNAYVIGPSGYYEGRRDNMRANGGITSIPRQQYGFGSFVSSIAGGIGDILGGAADAVGDVLDKENIDKIAQVASFIPGPHQPFAQAYTAGSSSGLFGDGYGGFQIGGFTPSGGTFGTTSTSGPSFSNFSFMPQTGGTSTGGTDFGGIFDLTSSFADMGGKLPTGNETGGGIFEGIDPRILEAGMKIGGNLIQNKLQEKQQEKNVDQAYDYLKNSYGTANLTDAQVRAIKLFGGSAVSAALARLAYESQRDMLEAYKKDTAAQRAGVAAKKAEYAQATRPEVIGRPTTKEDVIRSVAAQGGIMGSRKGYMFGTNPIPIRQNQAGVSEMDLRNTGGFIPPVGIKEKADDIPAMLSNNEFVFTADAVRAAGGGSVNKGAERMYALMKQLEGQA